jgi:choline dehydrogenase
MASGNLPKDAPGPLPTSGTFNRFLMVHGFDYVIVGAGTAGCVVACRLSEDPRTRVLLLEAGGSDRSPWIQVPIGYGRTFFDPSINWMYETDAEPGLNGRSLYWPRGKVIGGSGSINAMVYIRGQAEDFDEWRAAGNPGWGFADVLPYFRKSEDHDGGETPYHGAGGPMHVTDISRRAHSLCGVFQQTAGQLGFAATADFNGPEGEGVGLYQINTHRGFRASTANAFLRPALRRRNLKLETKALAARILFDRERASGVTYIRDGHEMTAMARREVILCGGAINSPQLLQLSGIGDPADSAAAGVPVRHALPAVGRNLADHLAVSYFYRSNRPTLNDRLRPLSGKILAGLRYLIDRGGPLSMSVNQGGGFVRSRPDLSRPDLQLYFSPVSYTQTPLSERRLLQPDPFAAFLLSFNACRPTSRGCVRIVSADPRRYPSIAANYLATDQDVADALAGCRLLRRLAATRPLADIITGEIRPGPQAVTDDDLLADFRARADTVYHPVGTCAMGPDPRSAVVDASLRVHGINGLRVIDASIFPTITSGNTNAPTVMVAEKGADLIKQEA